MSLATISQTTWEYPTRTLHNGTASAPTNRAETIAAAVWSYATRTLTAYANFPGGGTVARGGNVGQLRRCGNLGGLSRGGYVGSLTRRNAI